jgi:hypothetical protein
LILKKNKSPFSSTQPNLSPLPFNLMIRICAFDPVRNSCFLSKLITLHMTTVPSIYIFFTLVAREEGVVEGVADETVPPLQFLDLVA